MQVRLLLTPQSSEDDGDEPFEVTLSFGGSAFASVNPEEGVDVEVLGIYPDRFATGFGAAAEADARNSADPADTDVTFQTAFVNNGGDGRDYWTVVPVAPDDEPENPNVHKYLDLSTSHLPIELGMGGLASANGVIAYDIEYGWLMWVPLDDDSFRMVEQEGAPAEVLRIMRHARSLGCGYVRFDADGLVDENLPTWEW